MLTTKRSLRLLPRKSTTLCRQALLVGNYDEFKSDVLWVEWKAPSKEKSGEWNTAMREAVGRLHISSSIFLKYTQ